MSLSKKGLGSWQIVSLILALVALFLLLLIALQGQGVLGDQLGLIPGMSRFG